SATESTLYVHVKIQEVIPTANKANRPVFDKEPLEHVHNNDEYNVFTNEKEHTGQPESINDTYVVEQGDSNTTHDSSDVSNNEREVDQDEAKFQKERVLLVSLIENIKLKIDERKRFNQQLKKANMSLATKPKRYKDMKRVKEAEFECA
ncbi:hypothetical protein Tco_1175392, partial [Tanacetum coccineum]